MALRTAAQKIVGVIFEQKRLPNIGLLSVDIRQLSPKTFTVIVPTRDGGKVLETCIDSIIRHSQDLSPQIIVIDNGSRDPHTLTLLAKYSLEGVEILNIDTPFNYAQLNNRALASATGDFICFLNDDIEVLSNNFLQELAAVASVPEVGPVGALLVYPDSTIQHAGVYLWSLGTAFHLGRGRSKHALADLGVPGRPHEVMAVTGACLMVEKKKLAAVLGFDERFAVGLNDIDLCLSLRSAGFTAAMVPTVEMIHHESYTRGSVFKAGSLATAIIETKLFIEKWRHRFPMDPYLSRRNLHDPTQRPNRRFGRPGPTAKH